MASVDITAKKKVGDDQREATVTFDFGDDLDAAVQMFAADVIHSNFIQSAKITAQAIMRRMLEAGKSSEEIADTIASWKPGQVLQRTSDPVAAMLAKFGTMNPDEQAAYIGELKARAAG